MNDGTGDMLTVTELARELGITPRAMRFYETKGLVNPRRAGTTRIYTHRERGRLQLILRGKRLGFSLTDIGEYLDLYDADPAQHDQILMLLEKVNTRITALEVQKTDLDATLEELASVRKQALIALDEEPVRVAAGS
ncbi:MAG: MerR family DNA-binding transcriptional regulator [Acidiferrobacteraceae bacterium]|jgi:DNA-binding transcriptional MerR regulator|nr:MerR family DNA-binding transcriptional regulator [Acidiferrobacteraceae bacterium]HIE75066.1 MerR family DNA-binding transcriptional regulator [Gammaproteobacteria bacterium]MBT3640433.1 MerR family DNA-binding transcriptional regulator [Acidiferrobacteraceae bacterium]MBT3769349.1 MerR family DNA-binding transcriptional regulator [Acidiferrobacteraceae bacterium]MBT3973254.1 MerR family DNA-binding transcriptional regulator [Acidiferrobacteraceae bacterium]|tara:strand:+ start:942 stop:1352 length:411 start_codon:yes stop_codon:yes gene_type:complete